MDDFGAALILSLLIILLMVGACLVVFAFSMAVYHNPMVAVWGGGAVLFWLTLAYGIWWWDKL